MNINHEPAAGMEAGTSGRVTRVLAPLLIVLVCVIQYFEHSFSTLMGDDLYNLTDVASGRFASDVEQALLGMQAGKYRPVFQSAFGLLFAAFKFDLNKYIAFNLMLHAASALVLYGAMRRLAPDRVFVALTIGLLFASTRFADYQIWQVTGVVEGLSTFLTLLAVFFYVVSQTTGRSSPLWLALLAWTAACFTHERFLVLLPVAMLIGASSPVFCRMATRAGYVIAALAVAAVNIGYKKLYGGNFLVGTGGSQIEFDPVRIIGFFGSAIANSFGFNFGPTYLSGESMASAPQLVWLLSGVIALATLAAIALAVIARRDGASAAFKALAPGAVLLAAILGAAFVASVTIRQEFRWILTVYLFVLIAAGVGLSRTPHRKVALVLSAVLLASGLAQTLYYRAREANVFFFAEQFEVQRLRDLMAASADVAGSDTFLVVEDAAAQCNWAYGRGRLFKLYEDFREGEVHCVVGLSALPSSAGAPGAQVIASRLSDGATVDITAAFRQRLALSGVDDDMTALVPLFDPGGLNSQAPVSTPSGLGAFAADGWPTSAGPLPAIIVVSGFNVALRVPEPPSGGELRFGAGMPYPSTAQALFWVAVREASGESRRIWEELMTAPADGVTPLQVFRVPLEEAGDPLELVIGIDTPQGDSSGHWAVYAAPAILGPTGSTDDAAGSTSAGDFCTRVEAPPNGRNVTWCQTP